MKRTILAAVLLAGTALTTPASADPVTVNGFFTSDHCTGNCGPQPGGFATITVIDNGLGTGGNVGTLDITIALLNSNTFANGGQGAGFAFNLIDNPTITYAGVPATFDVVNSATNVQNAGVVPMDGFGNFQYGVDGTFNGSNGPTSLHFTISGINLDFTDFAKLSTNPPGSDPAFMALDIAAGSGPGIGNTGIVDLSIAPTPGQQCTNCAVPGPIAGAGIPGLISACFGMFGLRTWRRRRKTLGLA
jgi:hypothetical protein